VKVLSYISSFLIVITLTGCGTVEDPGVEDNGTITDVGPEQLDVSTIDEGAPNDQGVEADAGNEVDSGTQECSPQEVMTANGCAECDIVLSNVSQQIGSIANSHRVCTNNSDCTSVNAQVGCRGFCPFAVASNQKALFIDEVAELSEAYCTDPDFQVKCGFMTPSCMNASPLCEGGLCALKEVQECTEPNPQGCVVDGDCEEGKICKTIDGECFPSACLCDTATGSWICTGDCVGTCVEGRASACEGPNPQGCISTGCPDGQTCDTSQGNKPTSCHCSEVTEPPNWNCTKDGNGGICIPD
jgi:hypothetical protein